MVAEATSLIVTETDFYFREVSHKKQETQGLNPEPRLMVNQRPDFLAADKPANVSFCF
jgi:hypothetical protein